MKKAWRQEVLETVGAYSAITDESDKKKTKGDKIKTKMRKRKNQERKRVTLGKRMSL